MHSLVGVFIKDEADEILINDTFYHFKLIFAQKKERSFYTVSKEEKEQWMNAFKKVIGYSNLFDFYEIKQLIAKGKFGIIKSAVHKKTGKEVAIKILSKKCMDLNDIELQHREIEILKMC